MSGSELAAAVSGNGRGATVAAITPYYALETLGEWGPLQGFWRREEEKPFPLGGSPQAMTQADQGVPDRRPLGPHERRGQLPRIRRAQWSRTA
jgi:hypothetical protein